MAHRVCPWWLGYWLACPLRQYRQDPSKILAPYVREGMTVLEPGPGMGFFTLELARLVGATGRVVAVDIQRKMIDLKRRAAKAGLGNKKREATRSDASPWWAFSRPDWLFGGKSIGHMSRGIDSILLQTRMNLVQGA